MSHQPGDKPNQEGSVPLGTISECPSCGGDGKLHVAPGQLGPCWRCAGSGRVMAYRETKEQFDARMQKVKAFAAFCDQSEPPSSIGERVDTAELVLEIQQELERMTETGYGAMHGDLLQRAVEALAIPSATGPSRDEIIEEIAGHTKVRSFANGEFNWCITDYEIRALKSATADGGAKE